MGEIEKIIDNLNLPKQFLDKSEQLMKTLFAESFEEFGGMIADQVRLRRFKNQIKIFTRAQEMLKENNIDPKKVSLKVLAPLIEYSSYEEEDSLQDMWSNLVVNALKDNDDVVFQQNCISILSKLSSAEANLLSNLFDRLVILRKQRYIAHKDRYERQMKTNPDSKYNLSPKQPQDFSVTSFTFNINKLSKELNIEGNEFYFKISNLITLGLLKWETDVSVEATKRDEDPTDNDIDVNVYVYNDDEFVFTTIGEKFVKVVKGI